MQSPRATRLVGKLALVLLALVSGAASRAQMPAPEAAPAISQTASLGLAPETEAALRQALDARDYLTAEKLLLAEIARAPRSPRAARQLAFAGSVYFLNQDFVNAAIAWKKSQAIAPLDARLRFSLAMAYIRIQRPDWARSELEQLAAADPKAALYPYWLGRLDYDGHLYPAATRHFRQAVALDPAMARAWDNLGLCLYYQNQNDEAVESYRKAIELDRASANPSPWPYLNLAIVQQFLNQLPDAEQNLRTALRLDPQLKQAHFQLGTVLEDASNLEAAAAELREAARLDPAYPEPHMALARIYHKQGKEAAAREEVSTYRRLHSPPAP